MLGFTVALAVLASDQYNNPVCHSVALGTAGVACRFFFTGTGATSAVDRQGSLDMEALQDKVAVVTGAGSGIGEGIAHAASAAGMRVVVSDVDGERAAAVSAALPGESIAVATDVSQLDSVQALADAALEAFGAVHLLCNNAGVWVGSMMVDADIRDWRYLIDVNLYGVIHGIQVFLPLLQAQGEGHIVNTASMGGLISGPPEGLYCTTKFAIVGLSESLLMETVESGVGVSVLCPGLVKTNLVRLGPAAWRAPVPVPF